MIIEALLVGMIAGFLFYELTGISPGGVIAPGYLALYIHQPNKIAMTLLLSIVVWGILELLSKHLIIYGRRRLLLAIVLSVVLKIAIEQWIQTLPTISLDVHSIGYIIPGLIANELMRQRVLLTVLSLGIVTVTVALILALF